MYTLWHHCRIATMAAGHYQLLDDGAMLTGTHIINGNTYVFNQDGVWISD